MPQESQTAFAARLAVGKSYVTALKQQGRLVMDAAGKLVDVDLSLARIAETASAPERSGVITPGYSDARERKECYQAESARLDLLERQGGLCDAHEVALAAATAATVIRSALESMPHELSARLAPITDETRVRAILDEWRETCQHEIAKTMHAIAEAARKQ